MRSAICSEKKRIKNWTSEKNVECMLVRLLFQSNWSSWIRCFFQLFIIEVIDKKIVLKIWIEINRFVNLMKFLTTNQIQFFLRNWLMNNKTRCATTSKLYDWNIVVVQIVFTRESIFEFFFALTTVSSISINRSTRRQKTKKTKKKTKKRMKKKTNENVEIV